MMMMFSRTKMMIMMMIRVMLIDGQEINGDEGDYVEVFESDFLS